MSEKMFSREQYEQLRSFPEISRDELFRYFLPTAIRNCRETSPDYEM